MARLHVRRGLSTRKIVAWALGFMCLLVIGMFLGNSIQAERRAKYGRKCTSHLKQLGIAMQNYHDTYRAYPPAYLADAAGKPMHSWRVLLLPYLEQVELYEQIRFDEPWDSPHNRRITENSRPDVYRCPAETGPATETNYVVVTGPETMFPGDHGMKLREIRDGLSKTIAIVEIANSGIHWMEPRDLTLDEALAGVNPPNRSPAISSNHNGGAIVGWGDSHVSFLPNDLPIDKLRALLTASGGENVSEPSN